VVKHSTIASPSSDYTITYCGTDCGNLDPTTDTGTEYTFNTNFDTDSMMNDDGTITLNGVTGFGDMSYVEDSWPMEHTVQDMIKEYPALRIQYEKFIEIYNLVKDDYRSGQKKNV
tara:strand:- start:3738 stop:4082 length:345 start_codon:yes stop_codon:yes gene_type:complete